MWDFFPISDIDGQGDGQMGQMGRGGEGMGREGGWMRYIQIGSHGIRGCMDGLGGGGGGLLPVCQRPPARQPKITSLRWTLLGVITQLYFYLCATLLPLGPGIGIVWPSLCNESIGCM